MKRALIVQGGGMRGAHSAGVLMELCQQRTLHFDVVCGSSAGACSLAFWVSGQAQLLERIWGNYLHGNRFIHYRRLLSPAPLMDLDYLTQQVFVKYEPLDLKKIRASTIDFFITVTHCKSGQPHYLHNKDAIDILASLRASSAIPLAYPLPVWLGGEPYADGGIADSIPVQKALDEGCEELWIVLTQPMGFRKKRLSRLPWPRWVYRKYPGLAEALFQRHIVYNQQLDLIEALEQQGRAFVIRPQPDLSVSRLTRNYHKIQAGIAQGRRDTATFLASI